MAIQVKDIARKALQNIPMILSLQKGVGSSPGKGSVKPLDSISISMKSLVSVMTSILTVMKRYIDAKRFEKKKETYFNIEQARESNISSDSVYSALAIEPKAFINSLKTDKWLQVGILGLMSYLIPKEVRENLGSYATNIMKALGFTESQIDGFKTALEYIKWLLLANLGVKTLGSVIGLAGAFSKLLRLLPAKFRLGAAGAIIATAGIALSKITGYWDKSTDSEGEGVKAPAGSEREAIEFFKSKGWTDAQAAGIVGNLVVESKLDPGAVGDSGRAYGIAQWHPDRQATFESAYGKSIKGSTFKEQLEFVNYELNSSESGAAALLKNTNEPSQAAIVFDKNYERSAGLHTNERIVTAERLYNQNYNDKQEKDSSIQPSSGVSSFDTSKSSGDIRSTASDVSSISSQLNNSLDRTSIATGSDINARTVRNNNLREGTGTSKVSVSSSDLPSKVVPVGDNKPTVSAPIPVPVALSPTLDTSLFFNAA